MDRENLIQRIDERTGLLLRAAERTEAEIDTIRGVAYSAKTSVDALTKDEFAGLRRVIREEVELSKRNSGITTREWVAVFISLVSLIVSIVANVPRG